MCAQLSRHQFGNCQRSLSHSEEWLYKPLRMPLTRVPDDAIVIISISMSQ